MLGFNKSACITSNMSRCHEPNHRVHTFIIFKKHSVSKNAIRLLAAPSIRHTFYPPTDKAADNTGVSLTASQGKAHGARPSTVKKEDMLMKKFLCALLALVLALACVPAMADVARVTDEPKEFTLWAAYISLKGL